MLKALIVKLFLQKEVNALKVRLAEASYALRKIEEAAVNIPKTAGADTHKLAATVLQSVLTSADQLHSREEFVHDWEEKAYVGYNAGKARWHSTVSYAHELIEKTKVFF